MKNPIKELKKKIKLAKGGVLILAVIFIALIVNSICLTFKVHKLEKLNNIGYEKQDSKTCGQNNGNTCGNSVEHKCGNH